LPVADQDGWAKSRQWLVGPNELILLFSSSLDWRLYCKSKAAVRNKQYARLKKLGYCAATVSPDTPTKLTRFTKRRSLKFRILSDPERVVIQAFDVLEKVAGYDLPNAILCVIDPKGTITYRFSRENYTERATVQAVFQALRGE
jgi:peroxiredoxin